jgi:pyridoxal phosphate enzyme (YggS family)
MAIAENLNDLMTRLPSGVTLVAVSKTHPVERLMEAYVAGQRHFGENRVQEMLAKQAAMPPDVLWHMIGHMQSNKVRAIVPFVHLIHSIDGSALLATVDKEAARIGRVVDVLLQFHIATEETKFGLDLAEAESLLSSSAYRSMQHVRIRGVMGMATFTDNSMQVRAEFHSLKDIFNHLKERYFLTDNGFDTVSMGMSGDWSTAVQEGSTLVRVGSAIFGSR